jgi:diamine N-acetyltransferase
MQICTARLVIRPLERTDVDALHALRPHTDPLLLRYNILAETERERDLWFALRTGDPLRREWAIVTAWGQFIGRIGLREIDGQECARLGIGLGAEFVNCGYGTEALIGFLDWYFGEGGFSKIVLDVSAVNARVIHVYEKLGFCRVGDFYYPAEGDVGLVILRHPRYAALWQYFKQENNQTWVLYYDMELTREAWLRRME